MAINFPNNPVLDTRHTVGNVTWRWDGTTWQSSAQGGQQSGGGATVSVVTLHPLLLVLEIFGGSLMKQN